MWVVVVRTLRALVRPLPLTVLVGLVAATVLAVAFTYGVAAEQERRLLKERTAEVSALLSSAFSTVDSSLRVLAVAASSGPAADATFTALAEPLVTDGTVAVGVAERDADGMTVIQSFGDGLAVGEQLTGRRAALAERAYGLAAPAIVTDLVQQADTNRLLMARADPNGLVSYRESLVSPAPITPGEGSAFSELRVALYAAPAVALDRVVLTTEETLPIQDATRLQVPVGADEWHLAVDAREPLMGTFANSAPWVLLAGGLIASALAALAVAAVSQRREYALRVVDERTRELADTRAFLANLLTSGPAVVCRIEMPARTITYVSPNIDRVLGITADAAIAPHGLGARLHRDDIAVANDALVRAASPGGGLVTAEYRIADQDGIYRWVSATLVPAVAQPTGTPLDDDETNAGDRAVLVYFVDVDERHRADDARADAQAAAEAANVSKSQFLSRMSHELRTPLNSILGFGQLLELDDLTEIQRDSVDHILKGGRHLLTLINEVLDISRIEAGELTLSPEAVLAADVVDDAVGLIRPLAEQRGIHLRVDAGECDCHVFADRQRVKQVLINLLSNAVKYNRPHGTVLVSCSRTQDSRLAIAVTDTGVGIPAERIGMLFTPFERLGAESTGEEGTGIGLALSRRLTEAMGGTLSATSNLGQGSTFALTLPLVEAPVERYERLNGHQTPSDGPTDRRCVVLHIEDNASNLSLMERVLGTRPDVELVAAMYGRLGIDLARQHQPAIVLLDLHLPDMSGEEVLATLRDDPATASVPVAIISADASPGQVQRLLSAGAAAYLTKPINVRDLLRVVDEAVGAS